MIKRYKKLMERNLPAFVCMWLLLACSPVFASLLLDYIVVSKTAQDNMNTVIPAVLVLALMLLFVLATFICISLWAAFHSTLTTQKRVSIIIFAYLMIWLGFGNYYYFSCDVENILGLLGQGSIEEQKLVLKGVQDFWQAQLPTGAHAGIFIPVNRVDGYVDCLYFSGISILTIGYGDIVPVANITKLMVILEGFLGQLINVVAIGLWLSSIDNKP
ncbi:MAG: potassium channel family protein [Acidaminococcaceae bacterium]